MSGVIIIIGMGVFILGGVIAAIHVLSNLWEMHSLSPVDLVCFGLIITSSGFAFRALGDVVMELIK